MSQELEPKRSLQEHILTKELEEREGRSPTEVKNQKQKIKSLTKGGTDGRLTQYSQFGKALVPTSDTIATLPTGVYRIQVSDTKGLFFSPQTLVTDNLMRLPDSKSDAVIEEIEKFWIKKEKYAEYGLSFKRGFLLHGPPGSGKTVTVTLIIKDMVEKGGIVVLGENPSLIAAGLSALREVEPQRPLVVVMEDLDAIVDVYRESSLLSLLDGEIQVDNVVFLATTNYPEKLDQRITNRPSRFDKIVRIDAPNEAARRLYLESRLSGSATVKDAEGEHDLVALSKGFSIAHLRELVVSTQVFGSTVSETVERLKKMRITPKSDGGQAPMGIFSEASNE